MTITRLYKNKVESWYFGYKLPSWYILWMQLDCEVAFTDCRVILFQMRWYHQGLKELQRDYGYGKCARSHEPQISVLTCSNIRIQTKCFFWRNRYLFTFLVLNLWSIFPIIHANLKLLENKLCSIYNLMWQCEKIFAVNF
jgi:hypothetical protein